MVLAGSAMLLLGVYVAVAFTERRRAPTRRRSILVRGARLVAGSRVLLVLCAATFLTAGVAGTFGRLYPLRLVQLGLPADPVAWFTVLSVLAFLVGAAVLRVIGLRVVGLRALRRGYLLACGVAAAGIVALVAAPEAVSGSVAVLLAAGALPLIRTFGTIWVNRLAVGDVRATVHSVLAQAEYLGAIGCGLGVAGTARLAGLPVALLACGALLVLALLLVQRLRLTHSGT
jgi:hypothetical protein